MKNEEKAADKIAYTESEKKILDVILHEPEERFRAVTFEQKNPDLLYQLSPWRADLTDWLPVRSTDRVLEMEAGYGPLTGNLAEKASAVVCLEQTPQQYQINSRRQAARKNVECGLWQITGGDSEVQEFLEKEGGEKARENTRKFDWVLIYAPDSVLSLKSELELAETFTEENGRIVLAVDNRQGMRVRDGGAVPHNASVKPELEKLFDDLGWEGTFYYPYPSLEFPESIYSDRFLPRAEELSSYNQSFYRPRVCWFDEQKEYAAALSDGNYQNVANAYLCILKRKPSKESAPDHDGKDAASSGSGIPKAGIPIYVKFSNQRRAECCTVTCIYEDGEGKRSVVKRPFGELSRPFVTGISEKYVKLSGAYAGTKLLMNRCERNGSRVRLEYLTGRSMDTVLDRFLAEGRKDLAEELVDEYWKRLVSGHPVGDFKATGEFRSVFGDNVVQGKEISLPVTNIDMIFSNILLPDEEKKEGTDTAGATEKIFSEPWHVIDYEWTFDFPVPAKFVMCRALFYYEHYRPERSAFTAPLYYKYGITPEIRQVFHLMECTFQEWLIEDTQPIRDHFRAYGQQDVAVQDILGEVAGLQSRLDKIEKEKKLLEEDKRSLQDELGAMQLKQQDYEENIAGLQEQCGALSDTVHEIRASLSWRITAPLRAISAFFRRIFGRKGDLDDERGGDDSDAA